MFIKARKEYIEVANFIKSCRQNNDYSPIIKPLIGGGILLAFIISSLLFLVFLLPDISKWLLFIDGGIVLACCRPLWKIHIAGNGENPRWHYLAAGILFILICLLFILWVVFNPAPPPHKY